MSKQRIVAELSCVLDRGTATDVEVEYFQGKKHDDLVASLVTYLEDHGELLGIGHAEITQGLNDRGTDLIVTHADCKIGFQLKSEFDVRSSDFAQKVKAQLGESMAHDLDKWYLLICAPLIPGDGVILSDRIQHMLSELSTYKNGYVATYGPKTTVRYFSNVSVLSREDFSMQLQRRFYEPIDKTELEKALNTQPPVYRRNADSLKPGLQLPKNLDTFGAVLEWDLDREQMKVNYDEFISFVKKLERIPRVTRRVLLEIVRRESPRDGVLYPEVQSALEISDTEMDEQIAILEQRHWIQRWYDHELSAFHLLSWQAQHSWPILQELCSFAEARQISPESLIVDLQLQPLEKQE